MRFWTWRVIRVECPYDEYQQQRILRVSIRWPTYCPPWKP